MKKTILILAIISLIYQVSYAQAPGWQWAKSAGGVNEDEVITGVVDGIGNIYAAGYFESPIMTFGSHTITNVGSDDNYLVKYDANGNVIWVKRSGGTCEDWINAVAVDSLGNVYVAGFFSSPIIAFDSISLMNTDTSCHNYDLFLAKYDSSGNILWAKSVGGVNFQRANSIAIDTSGNIYVTGLFSSPNVTFGSYILTGNGEADVFLVKYDPNGNVIWAKSAGGPNIENVCSVVIDTFGNIIIAGAYTLHITFGTYTFTTLTNGPHDIFLVKYDPNGNVIWAKSAGGPLDDEPNSISTDYQGNIFVAGYFYSQIITFDGDTLFNACTTYHNDVFLAKYDINGNVLWTRSAGSPQEDYPLSVVTDLTGNAYITGSFSHEITFGNFTLTDTTISINYKVFLVKYNANGNVNWAKIILAVGVEGTVVLRNASDDIFLLGEYQGPSISFDTTTLTNFGHEDIFLAKLDTGKVITKINELPNPSNISIFPNPTPNLLTIDNPNPTTKAFTLSLTNIQGQLLFSEKVEIDKTHTLDLSKFPNGIYFLTLQNEKENYVSKVVVQR